jgi:hypothetical protein
MRLKWLFAIFALQHVMISVEWLLAMFVLQYVTIRMECRQFYIPHV